MRKYQKRDSVIQSKREIRKEAAMKFYNIRRSNDFFKVLSGCKGKVNIVTQEGIEIDFSGRGNRHSELCCIDGTIRQIEVRFQREDDLNMMLGYIMNERRTA